MAHALRQNARQTRRCLVLPARARDARDNPRRLGHLRRQEWNAQPQLVQTAIQLFGVAIDALGEDRRSAVPGVVEILLGVLVDSEEKL